MYRRAHATPLARIVSRKALASGMRQDWRTNTCRLVADAASIRIDAGSVRHDRDFCAGPERPVHSESGKNRVLTHGG